MRQRKVQIRGQQHRNVHRLPGQRLDLTDRVDESHRLQVQRRVHRPGWRDVHGVSARFLQSRNWRRSVLAVLAQYDDGGRGEYFLDTVCVR